MSDDRQRVSRLSRVDALIQSFTNEMSIRRHRFRVVSVMHCSNIVAQTVITTPPIMVLERKPRKFTLTASKYLIHSKQLITVGSHRNISVEVAVISLCIHTCILELNFSNITFHKFSHNFLISTMAFGCVHKS